MDVLATLKRALADRYDVESQIGAGGMALVFRARDLRHARFVAIKVLQPELAVSIGTQRFLREITFAASLQHPNLVPVYDSGSAEGQLYYVMPFMDGDTLGTRLSSGAPLVLRDVVSITRDVASALTFAHEHGVVHRDIKPDNILLNGSRAVVADLGIARALSQAAHSKLTGTGIAVGTTHYMSPEQALGDEGADARSDEYSLACVVYEMLTGEQPFRAPSLPAVLAQVISAPRPRPSAKRNGLSPAVDAVVMRGLSADPAERFASCEDFARALDEAQHGTTERAALARPARRRSIVLGAAGALLMAGVAWLAIRPPWRASAVSAAPSDAVRIAILPFTTNVRGNSVMSEGIIDLIAASLADMNGVAVVPARELLARIGGDSAIAAARAAAASLGATAIVRGSIVSVAQRARLTATVSRPDGTDLARMQFEGADSSTLQLVDSASIAILRAAWRGGDAPTGQAGAITSASLPAVQAYLTGQKAARAGDWPAAAVAFAQAVERDSAFALAYAALANAYGWTEQNATPAARQMFDAGARHAERLPVRERRYFALARQFSLGFASAVDSARVFVAAYPDDLDGWLLLGETRFHLRASVPASAQEILAPFDTLIARDSTYVPSYVHPIELSTALGDTNTLRRYVARYARFAPVASSARASRVMRAATGSPDTLANTIAALWDDPAAGSVLLALLAAPARRSPAHELAVITGLSRAVTAAGAGTPAAFTRAFTLARFLTGAGRRDSALRVVRAMQRWPDARNAVIGSVVRLGLLDAEAAGIGAMLDSVHASMKTTSASIQISRAERALTVHDSATSQALAASVLQDRSASSNDRALADGILGALEIARGDSTGGLRRLDRTLALLDGTARAEFVAPLRLWRVLALSARQGDDGARGRALLTTGFLTDLELTWRVRHALALPGETAWLGRPERLERVAALRRGQ